MVKRPNFLVVFCIMLQSFLLVFMNYIFDLVTVQRSVKRGSTCHFALQIFSFVLSYSVDDTSIFFPIGSLLGNWHRHLLQLDICSPTVTDKNIQTKDGPRVNEYQSKDFGLFLYISGSVNNWNNTFYR